MPTMRNVRGFTLIEAMMALSLLGAALLIAAPMLKGYTTRLQLQSAMSEFEGDLRKARSIAVSKNCNVIMVMFADGQGYVMFRDIEANGTFSNFVDQGFFPPHIRFSDIQFGDTNWLTFSPRGVPDNPGFARIYAPDGQGKEIRVAAGSGTVSVVTAPPYVEQMN